MKSLAAAVVGAILAATVSGCASAPCGSGADSGERAVAGLIAAARTADDGPDVCAFVAPGYTVSADDLVKLRATFADHPDDDLAFELVDQLGSEASVRVSDGSFSTEFAVSSDSDLRWTVGFGTLFGEPDPTS